MVRRRRKRILQLGSRSEVGQGLRCRDNVAKTFLLYYLASKTLRNSLPFSSLRTSHSFAFEQRHSRALCLTQLCLRCQDPISKAGYDVNPMAERDRRRQ